MEIATFIEALRDEGNRMGDAAARASVDAPVPTCPDWRVRDLLLHTGGVHRWAATIVGEARREPPRRERPQDIAADLPADGALVDWFRAGHAALVDTLTRAAEDLDCWTFMATAPTPLRFWVRRQAHETAIHRLDAEAAAAATAAADHPAPVTADFATDGIDELLAGFLPRNQKLREPRERTLHVYTTDTDAHWLVRTGSDEPRATRLDQTEAADAVAADTMISGPAAALYPALWNRAPWDALTISGRAELARVWPDTVRV